MISYDSDKDQKDLKIKEISQKAKSLSSGYNNLQKISAKD